MAWGFTEQGERVLLSVMLGMRESHEDWLALGRRPDRPRARSAAADRRPTARPGWSRRSSSAGPPRTASTAPFTGCATCSPSCASANASECARPTGRRSTTPSMSVTESSDSRRWSTSSTLPATPPRRNASPTTSTRSSCTCATRPGTAADGAAPNLLERSPAEVKRRPKVIGPFPGETSCLTLGLGCARPLHHARQERRQIQPTRTPTPTPHQTHRLANQRPTRR